MNYISVTFGTCATASVILRDVAAYAAAASAWRYKQSAHLTGIRTGSGSVAIGRAFRGMIARPVSSVSRLGGYFAGICARMPAYRVTPNICSLPRVRYLRGDALQLRTGPVALTGRTPAAIRRNS